MSILNLELISSPVRLFFSKARLNSFLIASNCSVIFGGLVAFRSAILVLSKSIVHGSSHVACPVEDLVKFIGILVPPILIGTFTTFVA